MAVPKRKKSRANTHSRRSQWKAEVPTLVKTIENGKVVYSLPHRAQISERASSHAAVQRIFFLDSSAIRRVTTGYDGSRQVTTGHDR